VKVLVPLVITDAMLTSSSLPETDHPAWAAGTVYAVGDRVILTSVHRIYQRLLAGSSPTAPDLDAVNWVEVGPTNLWAPLDRAVGTAATSGVATTMTYTITPGEVVTALALLDASCDSASVTVTVGAEVLYSRTYASTLSDVSIGDWYAYFFDSVKRRGGAVDLGLPAYSEAVITIGLSGTAPLRLGTLALGRSFDMGTTLAGGRISIVDYSTKETDAFGGTSVVERSFAKRLEATVLLPTVAIDSISRRLADIRAIPVIWIGDEVLEAAQIYGWCREWAIEMQYPNVSHCNLVVEGLV
jgi:hypothetical protein